MWNAQGDCALVIYNVKEGYDRLISPTMEVVWYPWMANKLITPKHKFMIWLLAHERMLTQEILIHMRIIQQGPCFFCGMAIEN